MERDYSQYPSPNSHIHTFLRSLEACPPSTNDTQITQLAKKYLGTGWLGSWFFNPQHGIVTSAKTLMRDVIEMESFSDAQKEIAGAITGLNILLKYEANSSKQIAIKNDIYLTNQYAQQIQDIFVIKEAIHSEPALKVLLSNPDFLKDFGNLYVIYGRNRQMDPLVVQSFIHGWLQPDIQPLAKHFIEEAHQVRQANLITLREGRIPVLEETYNQNFMTIHSQLTQAAIILEEEYKNFKMLIDDLFNNRTMLTNTQLHKDGLNLAFNFQASDPLSQRVRLAIEKGQAEQHHRLQLLETSQEPEKLKKPLELEQKLEGYRQRPTGFLYEKATWYPLMGPEDPIQPVIRTIGFATRRGRKNETSTRLDFTQALGPGNLNLSLIERKILGALLKECDSVILNDANVIRQWKESRKLPENLEEVLKKFENEEMIHLKTLSTAQKEDLVSEALRFAFEVNYYFANDLLTLQ